MKKRVLITGATGFIGTWLTKELIRLGHEVRVLARPTSDLSEFKGYSFLPWSGDVTDLGSLERAFRSCDTVFHLAGLVAYKRADRTLMQKVNVEGTANVLKACHSAQVKNLVYLSSVVTMGASFIPTEVLNESSTYNLGKYDLGYFETKKQAEDLVLEAFRKGAVSPYILNPSTIYGPGDGRKSSRKIQVKVAQKRFPFYTAGGVSIVGIEEVIEGIVSAWQNGRPGERYILSGDNITIQELFATIAEAAGVAPPQIYLPSSVLKGIGWWGDFLNQFGITTSINSENALTSTLYHWFDHSKASRELGFKPRPAKESIGKSVQWMKDNAILV